MTSGPPCLSCGATMFLLRTGSLGLPNELSLYSYTEEWHCPNEPHRLVDHLGETPRGMVNAIVRWARNLSLDVDTIRRILRGA